MNDLLQKHGCANVFTIPEGLKELMSDISREVLREQPPKMYDFIANYLSVLLITREHGILAVRVLDDLCDCRPSVAEHLAEIGLTGDQAVTIADIIKEEVENVEPTEGKETVKEAQIIKRILTKLVLDEATTAKVCQVARNTYRDYWYRKKILQQNLKVSPDEPWEIAAERTLQIYKSTKPSFTELTRAAEKIQAAYRGYYVRRHLLAHLKPKKKKRGPKVDLPGPPLDIAASREIDLGPLIHISVREDNVNVMFDKHATEKLGLPYDPQKAITHIEDTDFDENISSGDRSRAASHVADIKSAKSLVQPLPISVEKMPPSSKTSSFVDESEGPPRRSRLASHGPEPMLRQSRLPSQSPEPGPRQSRLPSQSPEPGPRQSRLPSQSPKPGPRQSRLPSQVQSAHLSFSKVPPELIPDDVQEVKEEIHVTAENEDQMFQEPSEVPEDIPDDRTEGDGESAPTTSLPTTAPETDASEVEDIAEDMATSGEEEG